MLEIPESYVIANQLNNTIRGKKIKYVLANQSPHKFAWYHRNPDDYDELLSGKTVAAPSCIGDDRNRSWDCRIVLMEGVSPRYYEA